MYSLSIGEMGVVFLHLNVVEQCERARRVSKGRRPLIAPIKKSTNLLSLNYLIKNNIHVVWLDYYNIWLLIERGFSISEATNLLYKLAYKLKICVNIFSEVVVFYIISNKFTV